MIRRILVWGLVILLGGVACSHATIPESEVALSPGATAVPLAPAGALKIQVAHDGLYQLSAADLEPVGLEATTLAAEFVRLSRHGRDIPIWVDSTGPTLYFYGQAPTSRYERVATYVLRWGSGGGPLMEEVTLASGEQEPAVSATNEKHVEQNHAYVARATGAVAEPWFWGRLVAGEPISAGFTLPELSGDTGSVTLSIWGASTDAAVDPDHRVAVTLNGQPIATLEWDGETVFTSTLPVPAGVLRSGDNELVVAATGDTGSLIDLAYLDWIDVAYQVPIRLQGGALELDRFVGSLSLDQVSLLFDVTDPAAPAVVKTNPARWQVVAETDLVALGTGGGRRPERILPLRRSDWSSPEHQADMVIIAPLALADLLTPLVDARRSQGLAVVIVPVEDIGDEFGDGSITPDAINAFLRSSHQSWGAPLLRFVLLIGEATYDYQNYLGLEPLYHVPTALVPVQYGGETVSDSRLTDLDGDARPDIAIGRWPVSAPDQVVQLVQRTLNYEAAGTPATASLFVADNSEPGFAAMSDRLIQGAGLDETAVRLYGASGDETVASWNAGTWLVNYTGHGSLNLWGKTEMLSQDRVGELGKGSRPPIVTQLTCLAGLFAHPQQNSLAETMLLSRTGPVAIVAATSLTLPTNQEPFAASLLAALADPGVLTVGEALLVAQQAPELDHVGGQEIIDTFNLLGDPAIQVVRPGINP